MDMQYKYKGIEKMQIHTERHGKKSMTGNIDSKIQKEQTRHLCSSLLTGMKNAHLADPAPFVCVCVYVCEGEKGERLSSSHFILSGAEIHPSRCNRISWVMKSLRRLRTFSAHRSL